METLVIIFLKVGHMLRQLKSGERFKNTQICNKKKFFQKKFIFCDGFKIF